MLGAGALTDNGSGTLTLSGADTYSGATSIGTGATILLTSSGSIANSTAINLAAGGTLDVSAYGLGYNIGGGTALQTSGTGSSLGTTAAAINAAPSSTVNVAGNPTLVFTPSSFTGDTTHPSLTVPQGGLALNGSSTTISNSTGTMLGGGTYTLIKVTSGSLSLANTNFTLLGPGIATNATASLMVSGGNLNLVVTPTVVPVPVITPTSIMRSGGNLIFSGSNGPANGTYYVLTSTNVALPTTNWTSIATNTFSPTGTFSVTNAIGTNHSQFFIIEDPLGN
jgi:autotransporter-associated beta strand protein